MWVCKYLVRKWNSRFILYRSTFPFGVKLRPKTLRHSSISKRTAGLSIRNFTSLKASDDKRARVLTGWQLSGHPEGLISRNKSSTHDQPSLVIVHTRYHSTRNSLCIRRKKWVRSWNLTSTKRVEVLFQVIKSSGFFCATGTDSFSVNIFTFFSSHYHRSHDGFVVHSKHVLKKTRSIA